MYSNVCCREDELVARGAKRLDKALQRNEIVTTQFLDHTKDTLEMQVQATKARDEFMATQMERSEGTTAALLDRIDRNATDFREFAHSLTDVVASNNAMVRSSLENVAESVLQVAHHTRDAAQTMGEHSFDMVKALKDRDQHDVSKQLEDMKKEFTSLRQKTENEVSDLSRQTSVSFGVMVGSFENQLKGTLAAGIQGVRGHYGYSAMAAEASQHALSPSAAFPSTLLPPGVSSFPPSTPATPATPGMSSNPPAISSFPHTLTRMPQQYSGFSPHSSRASPHSSRASPHAFVSSPQPAATTTEPAAADFAALMENNPELALAYERARQKDIEDKSKQ